MSHSVTITRTTTTSSGTAVIVNTGFLGSTPGLLKLAQLLLGAACVGVVGYYMDHNYRYSYYSQKPELFFLLVAVACLVGTFCLFTACLVSFATASIISKTIYEVIYHGVAFILYLAAGLTLIIEVNHSKNNYGKLYDPYLAASVLGGVCTGLVGYYIDSGYHPIQVANLFYLIAAVACLVGTFCLFTAFLFSVTTATFIVKTNYEIIYHFIAFILYLAASITLIVEIYQKSYPTHEQYLAASILGFVMAILYFLSTWFAYRCFSPY